QVAGGRTGEQMGAVWAHDHRGVVEGLWQGALYDLRAGQAGILSVDPSQVRLTDGQLRQIDAAEVATQQAQEIDDVARRVPVLVGRAAAQLGEHVQQASLRCLAASSSLDQPID